MRRLVASVAAGAITALVVAWFASWQLTVVASWSASGLVYLIGVGPLVMFADGETTVRLSTVEDSSHAIATLLLVASSTASLVGVGLALYHASHLERGEQAV